uniref:Uncharacterized protein n=1 Tax=Rhizophora mucronata TaxID=61149 RepID=A0A2P2QR26_RHIMU
MCYTCSSNEEKERTQVKLLSLKRVIKVAPQRVLKFVQQMLMGSDKC